MKKQSRWMSFVETLANQAVGFALAVAVLVWFGPSFGIVGASLWNGTAMTALLTVASVVRLFALRRLFEWIHHRKEERDADLFI